MNNNSTIDSIREHVVTLGNELEFATGIRAIAAERLMAERDIHDPEMLYQACEELIGTVNLFESYDDPLNTEPGELVLGQGLPFRSMEAYIALREQFGSQWLTQAMELYVESHGTIKLGRDRESCARKLLDRARCCFDLDSAWHGPKVASDGFERYQRAERIANMNAYLSAAA